MERTPPFPAPTSGMSPLGDAPDSTRSRSATPAIVVIPNKSTVAIETTVDTFTETTVVGTGSSTVEEREQTAAKPEDGSNYGPPTVPEMATVDISDMTTVAMHDRTTVALHGEATVDIRDATTVDTSTDISKSPPKERIAAADTIRVATVDDISVATVVTFDPSDARSTPLPSPAPLAQIEIHSVTTVDETDPTTVDMTDTATVVTSDRIRRTPRGDSGRIRQEPECTNCAVAFEPDYCGQV